MKRPTYAINPGDVLHNRYGLTLRVRRVVERGVVGSFGDDIHESLREWDELCKLWLPRPWTLRDKTARPGIPH